MSRLPLWESYFCCLSYKMKHIFFSPVGLGAPLECYLYLCRSIAKLEWQELLGCTLINGIVHFGQNEMCRTSALPDGLAMAVSLKNLITFASGVKEFTTRKYFKFHDIKNNHYRTNKTAEKNKVLAKCLPLLILFFKKFLQLWKSRWLGGEHGQPWKSGSVLRTGRTVG